MQNALNVPLYYAGFFESLPDFFPGAGIVSILIQCPGESLFQRDDAVAVNHFIGQVNDACLIDRIGEARRQIRVNGDNVCHSIISKGRIDLLPSAGMIGLNPGYIVQQPGRQNDSKMDKAPPAV